MQELFAASPMVFAGAVFAFALLIGSFLNVVIHRLPIMMERGAGRAAGRRSAC